MMTSPSDDFKRRMLAPIEDLLKEALDGGLPPSQMGGRNWQIPGADLFGHGLFGSQAKRPKAAKQKPGVVDEAAFRESMHALNGMVGLQSAKRAIHRLADFARIESERRRLKLPQSQVGFHCVFSGSAGTGKTSLARLMGKLLHALGLLKSGHTVEVDKSGLVGQFLGDTPLKVQKAFDDAEGGVLFIDEAYSLTHDKEDLYGHEAVDGIAKLMEDRNDRLVVIVAGYDKEMRKFIDSNPGLKSRFNRQIHFDDFDDAELLAIHKQMIRSSGFEASDGYLMRSELMWQTLYRDRLTFDGNARMVRSSLEMAYENQARRLVQTPERQRHELCQLMPADLDGVEQQLRDNYND